MRSPLVRLAGAAALFSTWLVLLLSGHALGGAIYVLLLAALAVFPWRAASADADNDRTTDPEETLP